MPPLYYSHKFPKDSLLLNSDLLTSRHCKDRIREFSSQTSVKELSLVGFGRSDGLDLLQSQTLLGLLHQLLVDLDEEIIQEKLNLGHVHLALDLAVPVKEFSQNLLLRTRKPLLLHLHRLLGKNSKASLVVVVKKVTIDQIGLRFLPQHYSHLKFRQETSRVLLLDGLLAKEGREHVVDHRGEHAGCWLSCLFQTSKRGS